MDYYSDDQLADMAALEQYLAEQRDAAIAAMEASGYTDAAELAAADRIAE